MGKPVPVGTKPKTKQPDDNCNQLIKRWVDDDKIITRWSHCKKRAGAGTGHKGYGRCNTHQKNNKKTDIYSKALVPIDRQLLEGKSAALELVDLKDALIHTRRIRSEFEKEEDLLGELKAIDIEGKIARIEFNLLKELNELIPQAKAKDVLLFVYEAAKKYISKDDQAVFAGDFLIIIEKNFGPVLDINKNGKK